MSFKKLLLLTTDCEILRLMRVEQKGFADIFIVLVLVTFVIAGIVATVFLKQQSILNLDENNLPKFVQADWIDLSHIGTISKFRSAVGHDYSHGTDETCRSMKHYFSPNGAGGKDPKQESLESFNDPQKIASLNGSKTPVPPTEPTIDIFSPVDGKISKIEQPGESNTPIGGEVKIRPNSHPEYQFSLGHVYPREIIEGQTVKAGQKIGVIGAHQSVDMVLGIEGIGAYRLVSYFEVMPSNIFEKYQQRFAVKDPSDFVISKEYRDNHPLKCIPGNEEFVDGSSSDPSENISLPK